MKKYLNSVEEVVKALKEKRKVIKETESGFIDTYEIINGFICCNGNINVQIGFQSNRIYTEEPEPLKFEVNRAYKNREGKKVFLFKLAENQDYKYYFIGAYGLNFMTYSDGKNGSPFETHYNDIVGYWDEEK